METKLKKKTVSDMREETVLHFKSVHITDVECAHSD